MAFKKIISFLFVLGLINYSIAQNSADVINYINNYKQLAIDEMQRTGVPAAIKLAQGIHETEAGTSDLVLKSNNHFGIKCKTGWSGEKVYHDDDARGECFRSYAKPEESYRDHSDFLRNSSRYAFLFALDATDYKGWAYGLKKAGYATNIKYSQILVRLIEQYNLEQYSLIALGKLKPSDEVLAGNSKPVTVGNHPDFDPIVTAKLPDPVVLEVKPAPIYPESVFEINKTKVVFVKGGVSLLKVAEQNDISLGRLLDFNDMTGGQGDILVEDQLIFLQRKRKVGANEFHILQPEETVYDVCQAEGIRYESLLALNQLRDGMEPAAGEKLYLINAASSRPVLASEKKAVEIVVPPTQINETGSADYTRHVVQTKETLYSISKKYGVAPEKIISWNKLDGMDLKIGQQLIIYKN